MSIYEQSIVLQPIPNEIRVFQVNKDIKLEHLRKIAAVILGKEPVSVKVKRNGFCIEDTTGRFLPIVTWGCFVVLGSQGIGVPQKGKILEPTDDHIQPSKKGLPVNWTQVKE